MENINLKSEAFRQNIYNLINQSNLPVSNIYFILTLLQKQIELQYYASLNESLKEAQTTQEIEEQTQNQNETKGEQ